MSTRPTFIVSDLHLGAVPPETERGFRRFLEHVAGAAGELLINGDLFDFWFEYRHVIPAQHFRVVGKLAEVVEAGVPITFVGGNHDAWGGAFLRDRVGLRVVKGPLEMELGGRRALVAHGDGVGTGDLRYRALKRVIRSPLAIGAFRLLHPDLGLRMAILASRTEQRRAQREAAEAAARGRAAHIRAWGERVLRERPDLELVVAGHAHHPSMAEVEPGRYYVNCGDWLGQEWSFVELPAGGGAPLLRRWPGD